MSENQPNHNNDIQFVFRLETLDDMRQLAEKFEFWARSGAGIIDTAERGEVSEADAVASYITLINTWEPVLRRQLQMGEGNGEER